MKYILVVVIAVLSFVIAVPVTRTQAQSQVATVVDTHPANSSVSKPSTTPPVQQKQALNAPVAVSKADTAPVTPKPTPAPVAAPAPVQAAPAQPTASGCGQYRALFAQYSWNVDTAVAICQAESGGNPEAVSNASINYDHVSDYGLMQLHGVDITDPAANVAYAYYHKYLTQGWGAWSTYTSGRYARFL